MTTANTLVRNGTHRREAPCHRCGWTQPLSRLDRREQLRLATTEHYRWLCDDCVTDLTATGSQQPVTAGKGTPDAAATQLGRTRSVA
jgi:hypothetical protein